MPLGTYRRPSGDCSRHSNECGISWYLRTVARLDVPLDSLLAFVEDDSKVWMISKVAIEPAIEPLCAMSSNDELLVLLNLRRTLTPIDLNYEALR